MWRSGFGTEVLGGFFGEEDFVVFQETGHGVPVADGLFVFLFCRDDIPHERLYVIARRAPAHFIAITHHALGIGQTAFGGLVKILIGQGTIEGNAFPDQIHLTDTQLGDGQFLIGRLEIPFVRHLETGHANTELLLVAIAETILGFGMTGFGGALVVTESFGWIGLAATELGMSGGVVSTQNEKGVRILVPGKIAEVGLPLGLGFRESGGVRCKGSRATYGQGSGEAQRFQQANGHFAGRLLSRGMPLNGKSQTVFAPGVETFSGTKPYPCNIFKRSRPCRLTWRLERAKQRTARLASRAVERIGCNDRK